MTRRHVYQLQIPGWRIILIIIRLLGSLASIYSPWFILCCLSLRYKSQPVLETLFMYHRPAGIGQYVKMEDNKDNWRSFHGPLLSCLWVYYPIVMGIYSNICAIRTRMVDVWRDTALTAQCLLIVITISPCFICSSNFRAWLIYIYIYISSKSGPGSIEIRSTCKLWIGKTQWIRNMCLLIYWAMLTKYYKFTRNYVTFQWGLFAFKC